MKNSVKKYGLILCCLLSAKTALAGFYVNDDSGANNAITQAVYSTKSTLNAVPNGGHASTVPTAKTNRKPVSKATLSKVPKIPTYIVRSGSLKRNVERIVRQAHWTQVVWSLPYDYRWVGVTHIQGNSVQVVLGKLLANYPVQAVFYEQNHVVQIKARPSIAYHQPKDLEHIATESVAQQGGAPHAP